MKEDLTAEQLREVLSYDPETGVFFRKKTLRGVSAGPCLSVSADGYRQIRIGKHQHRAHRLAWLYVHGHWPTGDIDHINRDKLDNRIANLRDVSRWVNTQNTRLNRWLTIAGRTQTLGEWARESGIRKGTLQSRVAKGWPEHRLLAKPNQEHSNGK